MPSMTGMRMSEMMMSGTWFAMRESASAPFAACSVQYPRLLEEIRQKLTYGLFVVDDQDLECIARRFGGNSPAAALHAAP